jgi:hypothetical protein
VLSHSKPKHALRGDQRSVITVGAYFQVVEEIKLLRTELEKSNVCDASLLSALRAIEEGSKPQSWTNDGPCVRQVATPDRMRDAASAALEAAEKSGLIVPTAELKNWLAGK